MGGGVDILLLACLFVRSFVRYVRSLVTLSGAKHNFRTKYANVSKFHVWIPHEKIGDPYFFLIRITFHCRVIAL